MFINSAKRTFTKLMIALLMIGLLIAGCQSNQVQQIPPEGFQFVAEIDLSAKSYDEEIVGAFTVVESAVTTLFYTLPNADTPYFDLSLIGPDNTSHLILHSENYRTDDSGGGTWEQNLAPGSYQLILTADPGPGTLAVYWGHEN